MENIKIIKVEATQSLQPRENAGYFIVEDAPHYPEMASELHAFLKLSKLSDVLLVSLPGAHPAAMTQSPAQYKLPYRVGGMRLAIELQQYNHLVIGDPGHFLGALSASFFLGTRENNLFEIMALFVEKIARVYGFDRDKIILIGGSAGGFAAFQLSTYSASFNKAFILNQQVNVFDYPQLLKFNYFSKYFGVQDVEQELQQSAYASRFCCIERVKNMDLTLKRYYFLSNCNDTHFDKTQTLHQELYRRVDNLILDTYVGPDIHAAPEYEYFKDKLLSAIPNLLNDKPHTTDKLIIRGD